MVPLSSGTPHRRTICLDSGARPHLDWCDMSHFNRVLFLTGTALLPNLLLASPVSGTLVIIGIARTGISAIDFNCSVITSGSTPCAPGAGNFATMANSTGSFAPYFGDAGFVQSLNFFSEPINQPFLFSNFLNFSPAGILPSPDIALDLTFIKKGTYNPAGCSAAPPAPGQQCTPVFPQLVTPANPQGLSPLEFQNLSPSGSQASFSIAGTARRISTGETSALTGSFVQDISHAPNLLDRSLQGALAELNTSGSFTALYIATFTVTPTPEPASTFLLGIGLSGLALLTRGRRNTRS